MRKRKVLILLIVPFVFQISGSCIIGGNCDDPEIYHYSFQSISVEHLDNSGPMPAVSSGPVLKHAYAVRVDIDREKIATIIALPRFSFFQSAYASGDCAPDEFIPADTLSSFKIFTLQDFDDNHAAGSDVSDYFRISNPSAYTALDDYIDMYGASVVYNRGDLDTSLQILLMTPPTLNTTHQFRVQIELTDGRVLESTTTTIDLIE
jgi:hypothetical protein